MKLEQYFFVGPHGLVIPGPDDFREYYLCGVCYGKEGFPDGSAIQTSPVLEIEDNKAHTLSSSVYELGSLNPDYAEMMDAEKNGIPVIMSWSLERGDNTFLIRGLVHEQGLVKGEITAQHGNYITLNGKEYFVIWPNCAERGMVAFMMMLYGDELNLKMEIAWNQECRINLGLSE